MRASNPSPAARYEIRYQSLFDPGRALSFPCDAEGQVPMHDLGRRAFSNYLYARAMVGRDYASPVVVASEWH